MCIYIYTHVYTHHMGICAKWWSQCVSLKNQAWIFSHESYEVAARKYAPRVLYACAGICICICICICMYIFIYICTLIYIHMYIHLHCKSEHAPFDLHHFIDHLPSCEPRWVAPLLLALRSQAFPAGTTQHRDMCMKSGGCGRWYMIMHVHTWCNLMLWDVLWCDAVLPCHVCTCLFVCA